jgi:hypothetical protein
LFDDRFVPDFQGVARPAKRKLELVNAAARLEDLRIPWQIAWKDYEEISRTFTQSESTTNGGSYFAGSMAMPIAARSPGWWHRPQDVDDWRIA